jgi:hypothetical protein
MGLRAVGVAITTGLGCRGGNGLSGRTASWLPRKKKVPRVKLMLDMNEHTRREEI